MRVPAGASPPITVPPRPSAAAGTMAESDALEEQFAGVDALIAQAEAEALQLPEKPAATAEELTEQERREAESAIGLIYGEDRRGVRPGMPREHTGSRLRHRHAHRPR
ncbi:hypothetical protein [Streptomyces mirabilis]|uniref:hypothetical protein n=1 Tax=Streptomyces mirabilis TaxID=68239 RepID=UPI0009A0DA5B|nr:hypothetical protein [Streptomyces mirabilis]